MSDSLCYLCQQKPPTFICFCMEVQVCQACISSHLLDNPEVGHKPVPVNHYELIQTLRLERKGKDGTEQSPHTHKDKLERRDLLRKEMDRLTNFHSEALLTLQTLRIHLEHQIASAIEEISQSLTFQKESIALQLKRRMEDLDDSDSPPVEEENWSKGEELLKITMEIKEMELGTVIKASVRMMVEVRNRSAERYQSHHLYKIFGGSNSISVFDAKSESHLKTLSTPIKFFHNCCSCELNDGNLLITGGSLTGRSRNEVYLYDPVRNSVSELASMHVARRSHCSLFSSREVYVFGGLLEEDRLSLCERYSLDKDQWSDLPHMKERRAYLGCCEYQGTLYVCGGSERPSMEKFIRKRDEFELIAIPDGIWVEENCSMCAMDEGILIMYGSFRGEVTRFDPGSGKFSSAGEMCVGNSWSCCAPVQVDRTVYMLRSDSIFKYHLDTRESAYVLRLAKLLKKRITFNSPL